MNLDKLFVWITRVIIACAATGNLDTLQAWVWRAQAKVIYESRTSTWGSTRFFPSSADTDGKQSRDKELRATAKSLRK